MLFSSWNFMVYFLPATGVALNLLLLGYFKYTNFAVHFLSHVVQRDLGHFDIILPLAISFFTFTQISYLGCFSRPKAALPLF
jgi:alginate O-acetyltransferase complex protein AlgI